MANKKKEDDLESMLKTHLNTFSKNMADVNLLIGICKDTVEQTAKNLTSSANLVRLGKLVANNKEKELQFCIHLSNAVSEIETIIEEKSEGFKYKFDNIIENSEVIMDLMVDIASTIKVKTLTLEDTTGKISSLIDVVENVTHQTNLLAVNASIEASHAGGTVGGSFSVVASQVKNLSQKTSNSINGVRDIVGRLQDDVKQFYNMADFLLSLNEKNSNSIAVALKTLESFSYIIKRIKSYSDMMQKNANQKDTDLKQLGENIKESAKLCYMTYSTISDFLNRNLSKARNVYNIILIKKDYYGWKLDIVDMFFGIVNLEAYKVKDSKSTKLGIWLEEFGEKKYFNLMMKTNIREIMVSLHDAGAKSIEAFNDEKMETAEKYYQVMEERFEELQAALDFFIEVLKAETIIDIENEIKSKAKKASLLSSIMSVFKQEDDEDEDVGDDDDDEDEDDEDDEDEDDEDKSSSKKSKSTKSLSSKQK